MKLLAVVDMQGNKKGHYLKLPPEMNSWKVSSFLDYIRLGQEESRRNGYLPEPMDPFRYESFRQLINQPALTLNHSLRFIQHNQILQPDDSIRLTDQMNIVYLDRNRVNNTQLNVNEINISSRNISAMSSNKSDIIFTVDRIFDFDKTVIGCRNGGRVSSFEDIIDGFADLLDVKNQIRFFYRIASVIYSSPFESISRILSGAYFLSGYEMWGNMDNGYGGICAEKTSALKFICDVLSVPSYPVVGSEAQIPENYENMLQDYVQSPECSNLPVWIQHHLLEIEIAGSRYLIDATGGNIPFLFLDQNDAGKILKNGYRARMVYKVERLNMRRVSNWVGDTLLTLCEYHLPELHFQYIFKQGLGLHISDTLFIGVYFDWGEDVAFRMQHYYSSLARSIRFPYPRFIHEHNMSSVPDQYLKTQLTNILSALRTHYQDKHYTGGFTFVLQPIRNYFWKSPRMSKTIKGMLHN